MVDVLKIGSSTLLSMQQALSTTGHNIANVNTEGYSRQTVNFASVEGDAAGYGYLGKGSAITGITRSHDRFANSQIQGYTSSSSSYQAFLSLSSRLDDALGNTENSLNTSLQRFFGSVQDLAGNPAGIPERQVMLGEAGNLVARQQKLDSLMQNLGEEVNDRLRSAAGDINNLADNIARLNRTIVSAASGGAQPNDLLDQRDKLLRQLAEKVSVSTVPQDDGAVNVFIGKGQGLVVGSQVSHLAVLADPHDPARLDIGMAGGGGSISRMLSGGEVQGLLDFRDRMLEPARAQLGLLALGLAQSVNTQHRLGLDLNGEPGGDFFSTGEIRMGGHSGNGGTAAPALSVEDAGQLRPSAYLLNYNGTQWQLTRLSDNTSVSGAGPLSLDGLTVDLSSGVPQAGDSFRFNPASDAGASFGLALRDPLRIAAASALSAANPPANAGSALLAGLLASDPGALPLAGPISLQFDADALGAGLPGFLVTGGPGGAIAYDPASESAGKTFTFAAEGLSFSLSGVPAGGDTFSIGANSGASGDNRNALALAELQHRSLLEGGNSTLQDLYGGMTAKIGVGSGDAAGNLTVESFLLQQSQQYRESVSGVNLDEEAANMLRYQQLYQAAAQLVRVADEMFQTLLDATR